jgi:hypothetical protein
MYIYTSDIGHVPRERSQQYIREDKVGSDEDLDLGEEKPDGNELDHSYVSGESR